MKNSTRSLHIVDKTIKGKKQFYIIAYEYFGMRIGKQIKYPEFKRNFDTKKLAREYGYEAAKKIEQRFKNIRINTRFLLE